jgi:DNA-binding transcriptional ArsR family regulator
MTDLQILRANVRMDTHWSGQSPLRNTAHVSCLHLATARRVFCLTIAHMLYKLCVMNSLDATFFALSDPTRRAILARLASGEATVMELAEPFEMSQPAVSRHLKVLEGAGLIARRIEGTKRPCRLDKAGIQAIEQWLSLMREALARNYDRLDDVLAAMQPEKGPQR